MTLQLIRHLRIDKFFHGMLMCFHQDIPIVITGGRSTACREIPLQLSTTVCVHQCADGTQPIPILLHLVHVVWMRLILSNPHPFYCTELLYVYCSTIVASLYCCSPLAFSLLTVELLNSILFRYMNENIYSCCSPSLSFLDKLI